MSEPAIHLINFLAVCAVGASACAAIAYAAELLDRRGGGGGRWV